MLLLKIAEEEFTSHGNECHHHVYGASWHAEREGVEKGKLLHLMECNYVLAMEMKLENF